LLLLLGREIRTRAVAASSVKGETIAVSPILGTSKFGAKNSLHHHHFILTRSQNETIMFASSTLHKLIQDRSWNSVEKRIETHPNEVRKAANCDALYDTLKKSKALPLHHAVAMDPPKVVVDKLLSSFDKAIRVTETAYHRTPLHVACMNHARRAIIKTLLEHFPDAAEMRDDMKRLPIHYAIANSASISTLQLLLNQFPDSCKVADHRGWLPLHLACGVRASVHVVELILDCYPSAILTPDDEGLVPLSLAKEKDPRPEVIAFLKRAMEAEIETAA
jgi:ankyrin repeat protein